MTIQTHGDPLLPSHAVQFYEREEYLFDIVADFIADGLACGEPAVVIATSEHCDGFAAALRARGVDVAAATGNHQLTFHDARQTLAGFMKEAMPDDARFQRIIGNALTSSMNGNRPVRVRAYGEMVDLLWRDGNTEAALRLEELWNDLAQFYTFALLCAYPMGNFYKESHGELFEAICRTHGMAVPTEQFSGTDAEERSREISILQQRAESLRNEVEHRKELEHALRDALTARRRAEDSLRDFVEHAPVAMHWVGPDGRIQWANENELKLLGYTADEYIGRNISTFHADRPVIDDILRRLRAGEELRDYEARLIAKDGSIRHVAINSNALFEDGMFVHTRCFTRDITASKHLEEERRRMADENAYLLEVTTALNRSLDYDTRIREIHNLVTPRLADRCTIDINAEAKYAEPVISDDGRTMVLPLSVGDRVLGALTLMCDSECRYSASDLPLACEVARRAAMALENARLYQLAQHANRAKDEFLATISHELRTPLTAVLGWSHLLNLGSLDADTTRVALDTIERSARTQATLIDDLLDLSKVVTGKLSLQRELVDVTQVVSSAVQTLRLAAEGKGIALDVVVPEEPLVVIGDPTRLQQVTWNLLSNAIKFSNAGGTVALALERAADQARISVRDTGRGITSDFLPHVFEAFRQADGANTRAYGGLGLGLAIVKYLTELHGGIVTAASDGEGLGATFVVALPLTSGSGYQS